MMEPTEQQVICMRVYEERSYKDIAQELGLAEEAVKKRFQRAMPKLAKKVACLRDHDVRGLVE